jgi:hypothetical protein
MVNVTLPLALVLDCSNSTSGDGSEEHDTLWGEVRAPLAQILLFFLFAGLASSVDPIALKKCFTEEKQRRGLVFLLPFPSAHAYLCVSFSLSLPPHFLSLSFFLPHSMMVMPVHRVTSPPPPSSQESSASFLLCPHWHLCPSRCLASIVSKELCC